MFLYYTLHIKEEVLIKAAGVIVEYNPFHNGHAYHLQETRKLTDADVFIAVMSGPFLQRGEPGLVSKWARTKMALEGGLDIVIELPYAFSTQKANTFANGAVSVLDALGVESLCFGSEDGNIESFLQILQQQQLKQQEFDTVVRTHMKQGVSYPKALAAAFTSITNNTSTIEMSQPNNILGLHYIQAIMRQHSSIQSKTIQRLHAHYHDQTFSTGSIASATSIRKQIESNTIDTIVHVVPSSTLFHLHHYYETYGLFHQWELYFSLLKYKLLTMTPMELQHIYEVEEGLEHRVLSYIQEAASFSSFMHLLKTKRYTWTRLQRLCLHVLTNTTKQDMNYIGSEETVPYIRLLGMSKKGQAYLSLYKKNIPLPLVSNIKTLQHPLAQLDQRASKVYYAIVNEPFRSHILKQDFTQPPIRYDEETKLFL